MYTICNILNNIELDNWACIRTFVFTMQQNIVMDDIFTKNLLTIIFLVSAIKKTFILDFFVATSFDIILPLRFIKEKLCTKDLLSLLNTEPV